MPNAQGPGLCSTSVDKKDDHVCSLLVHVVCCNLIRVFFFFFFECIEVFKYHGRLMAQDDDDIQAIWAQLRKALSTWACVGQVLRSKNALPFVAARFYQAIVQAILLYRSETWVISQTALARFEGFHIRAAYWMAKKYKPKCGPSNVWV